MMSSITIFLIALTASVLGAITGIGGGIIIKPTIDMIGLFEVSTISFLSGCTVLSMSIVSFLRNRRLGIMVDKVKTTYLAIGSIIGGIGGKYIFDIIKTTYQNDALITFWQSSILAFLTIVVFIYTLCKYKIHTLNIENHLVSMLIGLFLGLTSSFLGIGGGPINLMVLSFFFSMDSKKAAISSIYIIMLSQISSILFSIVCNTIPSFQVFDLVIMAFGGVSGGLIGSAVMKKITGKGVDKAFLFVLIIVILICTYNIGRSI